MGILESSLDQTEVRRRLRRLGIEDESSGVCHEEWAAPGGAVVEVSSPAGGELLGLVRTGAEEDYDDAVYAATRAWPAWRDLPAPVRGTLVAAIGSEIAAAREDLAFLIALETGKLLVEAEAEVDQAIHLAAYAAGLAQQPHGLALPAAVADQRIEEQWHPVGIAGCLTSFAAPAAAWAGSALVAAACGDAVVWKPSSRAMLTAIALHRIAARALERRGSAGVFALVCGPGDVVGDRMIEDRRLPFLFVQGSRTVARRAAEGAGSRLARTLIEPDAPAAAIVAESAEPRIAVPSLLAAATASAGQAPTALRRVFLHEAVASEFGEYLRRAFADLRVGHPLFDGAVCGPLSGSRAVAGMEDALDEARRRGSETLEGSGPAELDFEGKPLLGGCYRRPALMMADAAARLGGDAFRAPLLEIYPCASVDDAVARLNREAHGLPAALYTSSHAEAQAFLGPGGIESSIATVNSPASAAISGGGRAAGPDAWKSYMRRRMAASATH